MTATVLPDRPGAVLIESIEGDGGRLSLDASKNCVGIAALETLKLLGGQPSCGISLTLKKVIMACKGCGRVTREENSDNSLCKMLSQSQDACCRR